jgi:hypothetical protein
MCIGVAESYPEARASAVRQAFSVLTETHQIPASHVYASPWARASEALASQPAVLERRAWPKTRHVAARRGLR